MCLTSHHINLYFSFFLSFVLVSIAALVNDNLIGGVLFFAAFADGLVCAVTAYVLSRHVWSLDYWGIYVFVGFLIGLIVTLVAMELISSAVIAFFVCYADDPNVLQQTKPGVYNDLQNAIHNYRGSGGRRPNDTIAAEQLRDNHANGRQPRQQRQQQRQQNQDALFRDLHSPSLSLYFYSHSLAIMALYLTA